ncbi:hypothetical protein EM595_0161 [Duffyella gerundensis]|uniref:Uncharacterized protein n=1 Tax=Duffyella gerundensis TaxID=1619313 RepID=A0A0U5KX65_9GAMM|nr:hypothetical protein EM595_0161 [Duffyella gerundensis]
MWALGKRADHLLHGHIRLYWRRWLNMPEPLFIAFFTDNTLASCHVFHAKNLSPQRLLIK